MKQYFFIFLSFLAFTSCNSDEKANTSNEIENNEKSEIEILNEAIIAQPNNYQVYINRADFYIKNGQFADAKADADKALKSFRGI